VTSDGGGIDDQFGLSNQERQRSQRRRPPARNVEIAADSPRLVEIRAGDPDFGGRLAQRIDRGTSRSARPQHQGRAALRLEAAAAKPPLTRLAAGSPSTSAASSSSRVWPLLEAVLLEEAGELFVGLGVVVVTLGVGEVEEVPGIRGLERGIDGFDAWVGDRSRWKAGM